MNRPAAFLLLSFFLGAVVETPGQRGSQPPVIRKDDGPSLAPMPLTGRTKDVVLSSPNQAIPGGLNPFGAQPTGPRDFSPPPGPFLSPRTLFEVDGLPITGPELNELFHYYQSFRKGSPDLLMRDALESLIPLRVLRARLGAEEAGMRVRMDEALAALQGGMEFAEVVARYSEDDDEDAPLDGQYTFARAVATQPFDRLSHTMPLDELSAPFWTKYGLHVLQVTDYERGEQPDGDQTHVRHILIMWPTLRTLDQEGKDIRKVIHGWVAESQIRVMELAVGNMLPPQNRNESASGS